MNLWKYTCNLSLVKLQFQISKEKFVIGPGFEFLSSNLKIKYTF